MALDCGIRPERFWDYSAAEIADLIDAHTRAEKKEKKRRIIDICDLGQVIISDLSNFLAKKEDMIRPWDLYPSLFEEEQKIYEEQRKEKEYQEFKERRAAYAEAFNARRKERGCE